MLTPLGAPVSVILCLLADPPLNKKIKSFLDSLVTDLAPSSDNAAAINASFCC